MHLVNANLDLIAHLVTHKQKLVEVHFVIEETEIERQRERES